MIYNKALSDAADRTIRNYKAGSKEFSGLQLPDSLFEPAFAALEDKFGTESFFYELQVKKQVFYSDMRRILDRIIEGKDCNEEIMKYAARSGIGDFSSRKLVICLKKFILSVLTVLEETEDKAAGGFGAGKQTSGPKPEIFFSDDSVLKGTGVTGRSAEQRSRADSSTEEGIVGPSVLLADILAEASAEIGAAKLFSYIDELQNSTAGRHKLNTDPELFFFSADICRAAEKYGLSESLRKIILNFSVLPDTSVPFEIKEWIYAAESDLSALCSFGILTESEEGYTANKIIKNAYMISAGAETSDCEDLINAACEWDYSGASDIYFTAEKKIAFAESILNYFDGVQDELLYELAFCAADARFCSGSFEKSAEWFMKIPETAEYAADSGDYGMVSVYCAAAYTYSRRGEYQKALLWYLQALKTGRRSVSDQLLFSELYNNIAFMYLNLKEYSKAIKWFRRSLDLSKTYYGFLHPEIASVYNNIAYMYADKGEFDSALEWHFGALEILQKSLDADQSDVIFTFSSIAGIYADQSEYQQSLEWYFKSKELSEEFYGDDHTETAVVYNNIAFVFSHIGEYDEAIEWFKKIQPAEDQQLPDKPYAAAASNNIAWIYSHKGEYTKALEWYKKALAISEKTLGVSHPDTATACSNIAFMYSQIEEHKNALSWYQKSLTIRSSVLGPEHPDTVSAYNSIAFIYASHGEYQNTSAVREKYLN